jgi:hypothetical protein
MTHRFIEFVVIGLVLVFVFWTGYTIGQARTADAICHSFGYIRGGYFDGQTVQCDLREQLR